MSGGGGLVRRAGAGRRCGQRHRPMARRHGGSWRPAAPRQRQRGSRRLVARRQRPKEQNQSNSPVVIWMCPFFSDISLVLEELQKMLMLPLGGIKISDMMLTN